MFGATGFFGRYVANRLGTYVQQHESRRVSYTLAFLGKEGTQMIIPYRSEAYYNRMLKLAGDLGQVYFLVRVYLNYVHISKVHEISLVTVRHQCCVLEPL